MMTAVVESRNTVNLEMCDYVIVHRFNIAH